MPTPPPTSDSIPAFAREVIALYTEAMPEVRFPDLDLQVLESTAAELRAALLCVERATAELEAARTAAQQHGELLEARAERALSYARVFAEGDALLSERIVALGRSKSMPVAHSAPPKKRGRPRKNATSDSNLFEAEPVGVEQGLGSAA
jgi:hypothetical protein